MKRALDIILSATGLLVASPLLAVVLFLVWRQDGHSPFYLGERVGRDGKLFRMVKIRSMVAGADKTGVESTAGADARITALGHFIRRYKLDELTQLWNVLMGEMSIVGPRPNTRNGVAVYTPAEQRILTARPGITDISSIVFSDEGEVLRNAPDPDAAYDVLIRPWKSRLCLFYIDHGSVGLDAQLIWLTATAIFSRPYALRGVETLLRTLGADARLIAVARRDRALTPTRIDEVIADV